MTYRLRLATMSLTFDEGGGSGKLSIVHDMFVEVECSQISRCNGFVWNLTKIRVSTTASVAGLSHDICLPTFVPFRFDLVCMRH